ncbi:hypothetical protein FISHEDRAFT_69851 [Fistulina hepatica ATCC 64428]|uniref:Cupin type-2 domain-containing protein n=1 Tax=Fistulina hepatica ATCC 64428 TaxID=1128425 RepID=A0A0D7ALI6_9AGAR|nr:hypothetical protein FISHEDRAFT_69851 [Fistulina hepatica ATCC 64428]
MEPQTPLLRAEAIQASLRLRPHPVNESNERWTTSLGDAVGLNGLGIHYCRLPSHTQSTTVHHHSQDEEWLYILSGTGKLILYDGERVEEKAVSAGDFMGFKAGPEGARTAHALQSVDSEVRYLCGGTRRSMDMTIYPLEGKVLIVDRNKMPDERLYADRSALSTTTPAQEKEGHERA